MASDVGNLPSKALSNAVGSRLDNSTGNALSDTIGSTLKNSTSKAFSHFATNNGTDNSTNPQFGVGIGGEGGGKQAQIQVSALPSGMNLSNVGVYGYTTVTLAPTIVRPDAGMAPTKEVTVIPLTRPYKIGITTIDGKATSVIEWLPGASNFAAGNGTFSNSTMQIGDKAPTMQQSVQGLDVPTAAAKAAAPQSDTNAQVTAAGPGVVQASAAPAAASPNSAANALAGLLGQVKSAAAAAPTSKTTAAQAKAAAQPSVAAQPQSGSGSTGSGSTGSGSTGSGSTGSGSTGSGSTGSGSTGSGSTGSGSTGSGSTGSGSSGTGSGSQQQAVDAPSSDQSTQKAPIVILNPDNSAVAVANLPAQVQPAQGNTNPEKVIKPQVISTIPSIAPIIPQTAFNVESATGVLQQQQGPVQTSPVAQANAGPSREFQVVGNSIVQVNKPVSKPPNAAAAVLAAAYTSATAIPGPKSVNVGNAAIKIQAVPASGTSGPREFIIGTQVAQLGQTVTENNTPVVVQTNAGGQPVAMVGASPAATLLPASAIPVAGAAELVVGSQTIAPGASMTIGPVQSATIVALQTDAHGSAEVVAGSSTMPIAAFLSQHTDATLQTAAGIAAAGPTMGASGSTPSNVLADGSQTLGVNMPAITVGSSIVRLATDSNGVAEVIAGSTTMPVASFLAAHPSFSATQVGADSYPSNGAVAIGSQTLEMSSAITVGTSVLSMATDAAGHTDIVEGSSTVPLSQFLSENPSASVVVDALQASDALTLAGVTVAPVAGATDSAIVVGSMTLKPGESVTETFGSSETETFIYESMSGGSMALVVMDQSTTATRPLPTDFLSHNTLTTSMSDAALPSKTSASQAGPGSSSGSAGMPGKDQPVQMLLKAMTGMLLSLVLGFLIV